MASIYYGEQMACTNQYNELKEDKMKRVREILEKKGTQVWFLVCVSITGFLYLASVALLTARILPV